MDVNMEAKAPEARLEAAIYSFSLRGAQLSKRVQRYLESIGYSVRNVTVPKYANEAGLEPMSEGHNDACATDFNRCATLVFIGAVGIAVRTIAPFIKSKLTDPAVISIDERANFIIPLLAGHIGGANEMARCLALNLQEEGFHAIPCVTTATDVNGLFAVDEWAARNNMVLCSLAAAKDFAAALVGGEKVGLYVDAGIEIQGELPRNVEMNGSLGTGMAITLSKNLAPFRKCTVRLLPRIVHLGIGCRRNTPIANIEELVLPELERMNLDKRSIAGIASVDLKKDEQGLLAFAQKYNLPATFYSAEELLSVAGDFTPSAFVQSVVGVSNVCERSAVLDSKGGRLALRKTSKNGVTLAIAVEELVLDFQHTGLRK
ncbi:MAG: cobalamin biosynthesis protein [Phascolarctobacterium sp.]|nr:cobalamin biosynthesis protein [Phascolarctobacterium sp.]